jgi:hypothetical protein
MASIADTVPPKAVAPAVPATPAKPADAEKAHDHDHALPGDVPANHPAKNAIDGMIKKSIMRPQADGKFHGSQPVTRYELAVILDHFVQYIETSQKPIKQTKFPVPSSALTAPETHWAHQAQVHLLQDGFVPATSPLVKKPGTVLVTGAELSEILATVTSRIVDRSLPATEGAGKVE